MFICCEIVCLVGKYVLSEVIEDVPEEVEMQLQRQEFLVSKVIENTPDEVTDDFRAIGRKTNIIVTVTDMDWDDTEERAAREAEKELQEAFDETGGEGEGEGEGEGVQRK
jgi:predicted Zn-dependent protease with MMP-like domain